MASGERRKCKGYHKLFRPDPRSRYHQRYCAAQICRTASKAASQACWLAAPENQDYFRGPANVVRVKAWRSHHPGYWRKKRRACVALQDLSLAQPIDFTNQTINFAGSALQDLILAQPAVLIGLIAHIVGTPLQDDRSPSFDHLVGAGARGLIRAIPLCEVPQSAASSLIDRPERSTAAGMRSAHAPFDRSSATCSARRLTSRGRSISLAASLVILLF